MIEIEIEIPDRFECELEDILNGLDYLCSCFRDKNLNGHTKEELINIVIKLEDKVEELK